MPAHRKLTDEQILAIRAEYRYHNAPELAKQYGITKQYVSVLVSGTAPRARAVLEAKKAENR
jgi:hypothetical protein